MQSERIFSFSDSVNVSTSGLAIAQLVMWLCNPIQFQEILTDWVNVSLHAILSILQCLCISLIISYYLILQVGLFKIFNPDYEVLSVLLGKIQARCWHYFFLRETLTPRDVTSGQVRSGQPKLSKIKIFRDFKFKSPNQPN